MPVELARNQTYVAPRKSVPLMRTTSSHLRCPPCSSLRCPNYLVFLPPQTQLLWSLWSSGYSASSLISLVTAVICQLPATPLSDFSTSFTINPPLLLTSPFLKGLQYPCGELTLSLACRFLCRCQWNYFISCSNFLFLEYKTTVFFGWIHCNFYKLCLSCDICTSKFSSLFLGGSWSVLYASMQGQLDNWAEFLHNIGVPPLGLSLFQGLYFISWCCGDLG